MSDRLSELLAAVRLESFASRRLELSAPWGLRVAPSRDVRFCTVVRGVVWLDVPGVREPALLGAGDYAMIPAGHAHTLADSPTPPRTCAGGRGGDAVQRMSGEGGAVAEIIIGGYRLDKVRARPLLRLLPDVMVIAGEDGDLPQLTRRLGILGQSEASEPQAGAAGVMRHMATLIFVSLIRQFLLQRAAVGQHPEQIAASPISTAVAAVHARPGERWTVERLARLVGMSRSAFAAAFTETIGEPPMRYLSTVRMAHAAELLRSRVAGLADVASEAGYSTTIAFLRAFKRQFGVTPSAYRAQVDLGECQAA